MPYPIEKVNKHASSSLTSKWIPKKQPPIFSIKWKPPIKYTKELNLLKQPPGKNPNFLVTELNIKQ